MLLCAGTPLHAALWQHQEPGSARLTKPCSLVPAPKIMLLCASRKKLSAEWQRQKPSCCVPPQINPLLRGTTNIHAVLCGQKNTCSESTINSAAVGQHKNTCSVFGAIESCDVLCQHKIPFALCQQKIFSLLNANTKKATLLLCASRGNTATLCSSKNTVAVCLKNKPCYTSSVRPPEILRLCAKRKTHVVLSSSPPTSFAPTQRYMLLFGSTKHSAALSHYKTPCCSVASQ